MHDHELRPDPSPMRDIQVSSSVTTGTLFEVPSLMPV
jgi:hypothetical protein